MNKINVSKIFVDHFRTLVNENNSTASGDNLLVKDEDVSKKMHAQDIALFFIFPAAISGIFVLIFHAIEKDVANTIITILSIFVGLLINVIVLLFDLVKRDEQATSTKNRVLRQTLTNVAYTILTGLIGVIVTLLTFFNYCYWATFFSFLSYFLLVHIFFTLLMIMKRMYALFMNDIVSDK